MDAHHSTPPPAPTSDVPSPSIAETVPPLALIDSIRSATPSPQIRTEQTKGLASQPHTPPRVCTSSHPTVQRRLDGTTPLAKSRSSTCSDARPGPAPIATHAFGDVRHGPQAAPQVIVFDNTKAGLQSVDKEKTEALIKELSKNSSFYQNEERKAKNRQRHIEALLEKTRHYDTSVRGRPDAFRRVQREVADLEAAIEAHRDFGRIYVHMDMDMFFAAVEMKKNPHYASVPLGIGGIGMLSTTNYVARQYGVRSGMPGFIGLRLCPELVIVPTDFPACKVESAKFKDVVRSYDPAAHGLGMDEIMMCLNDYLSVHYIEANALDERFDAAEKVVEECRRRVAEATGLTASAGIAPTMTLAKMASNYKKPNGQSSVRLFTREAVMDYLSTVPVRQVPGIGKAQESILAGLGICTLGGIYAERHRLYCILTRKTYEFLLCSAMGVGGMYDSQDATTTEDAAAAGDESDEDWWRKSVGHERTFRQLLNPADLQSIAYRNLRDAHGTLVKEHLMASQVVLKLKFRSFHVKQHSKSLNTYTDSHEVLQGALDELLRPVMDRFAEFRLLGVRLEKLKQRADADGEEGATSVLKSTIEDSAGQKTLKDFFTRQTASVEQGRSTQRASSLETHKRLREAGLTEAAQDIEDTSSDVEVLVVSSESQLAEGEGMEYATLAPPSEINPGRQLRDVVTSSNNIPMRKERLFVDLDDEDANDDDDDVTLVE